MMFRDVLFIYFLQYTKQSPGYLHSSFACTISVFTLYTSYFIVTKQPHRFTLPQGQRVTKRLCSEIS